MTGLHLHGLNKNTKAFSTLSPSTVDAFAEEFGFIKTATLTMDTVSDVRKFTDEVGETGKWRGEAVEGFVVRCKVTDRPSSPDEVDDELPPPKPSDNKRQRGESSKNTATMHPPYPPGSDYFFKIKFDEPYLMYRAWREITKSILSAKAKGALISIPKSRLARPENKLYSEWVEREIDAHKEDFEEFQKGKGIIETRERFLKWLDTTEGQAQFAKLGGSGASVDDAEKTDKPLDTAIVDAEAVDPREKTRAERDAQKGKLVIVPIAVPGCGTFPPHSLW